MDENREMLLKKLTGLLKRITDADDDYTVTADQRAALMELESLTWNYPTPQQARARSTPALPQASHHHHDDDDDTDDDDDDDSYYVDMVPYDMTERLKEVNRALIEDPTPAECDRAITVRFREVIADYQSPREYYPSDSDDGYGDSSDLLYDAEEEEDGLTSLTPEVKEVLGGNVNVVDLMAELSEENGSVDHNNAKDDLIITDQEDSRNKGVSGSNEAKVKWNDDKQDERKTDVPKLQLGGHQDESQLKPSVNNLVLEDQSRSSSQVPSEKTLLKVDDSGLADLETFMKENDNSDILDCLSGDPPHLDEDEVKEGTVSLIEVSERIHIEKGHSSLGDVVNEDLMPNECNLQEETQSNIFFQRRESSDVSEPTNLQLPARSDADFASFEYSDDFEEFQDETEHTETESKEEVGPALPVVSQASPLPSKASPKETPEDSSKTHLLERTHGSKSTHSSEVELSQKQGHRSRKDQSPRKTTGSSGERSKKRTDSKSPSDPSKSSTPPRTKPKHVAAAPPMIKPALLSSEKLTSMKTSDSSRHRTRATTASRAGSRSVLSTSSSSSSSSSSSPLSSASSSSSSSSSLSTYSSSNIRGRNRTSISGPVRPTAHRSTGPPQGGSSRGPSSSPVRPPINAAHHGLTLTPTNPAPGGRVGPVAASRAPPHAKVRKAASASDLHKVSEDPEERKKQNDEVFKAWLRQKNRQAAITKRQHHVPSGGKNSSEVAERRKRAEEAFQAWLSRKREQLRLEKKLRGERRRLEDQSRYARSKTECELAYKEWCRRKREEVRTTTRVGAGVPRSQSLERPWAQEKTRKLYSAYLNGH